MNTNLAELEQLIALQETYFENLIELGLMLENEGQHDKAFQIYKNGLKKAEKAKIDLSSTMMGML